MKLGIITSGRDCQGINAAIRAIVKTARREYKWDVLGFSRGWQGVIEGKSIPLDSQSVSGILPSGGTILGTSLINPAIKPLGIEKIIQNLKSIGIEALVVIGGRDALSVSLRLSRAGIQIVCIPKSVNNNIARTEYSIGFQSALAIVTDAVDKLHTIASAHHRVMILEVVGRNTGWIALYGGLAGGADWIIIPEFQSHFNNLVEHLKKRRQGGKNFSIIVVSEGARLPEVPIADVRELDEFGQIRMDRRNIGSRISGEIEKITGFETRVTVLGHLQRGGPPVAADRVLATRMGVKSVELVKGKNFGKIVTFCKNKCRAENLSQVIKESPRIVPIKLYNMARVFY